MQCIKQKVIKTVFTSYHKLISHEFELNHASTVLLICHLLPVAKGTLLSISCIDVSIPAIEGKFHIPVWSPPSIQCIALQQTLYSYIRAADKPLNTHPITNDRDPLNSSYYAL